MKLKFSAWWMFACVWLASRAMAAPVEIAPGLVGDALQPQVAINDAGVVLVVFGRGEDLYLAVSKDGGTKFEAPRKIGALPKLALGMRRGPRIAVAGNDVTVAANNREDLFAFHSADGGVTWSAPVKVNDVPTSAREGLHNLATGPAGRVYLTWLDLRSGGMEIYGALSRDAGKTWATNERVYHSPDGHVCECCHPSAAFNAKGDLAVMWRNWVGGSRDLWTAVRRAGANEFEPAARQGAGTWNLAGCPMDGGTLLALDDGAFASVWRREQEIVLALKPGTEQRIAAGTQPVAVVARGAVHLWWEQGADLVHLTATNANGAKPTVFASGAKFASAAASPKSGNVVVAFERTIGGRKAVFVDVLR